MTAFGRAAATGEAGLCLICSLLWQQELHPHRAVVNCWLASVFPSRSFERLDVCLLPCRCLGQISVQLWLNLLLQLQVSEEEASWAASIGSEDR